MAKHKSAELLHCMELIDKQAEVAGSWFMVHTHIGHEAKVKQLLEARDDSRIHEVVEKHKLFPGYVLMRCDLSDDLWRTVRAAPSVSGFIGASGAMPMPMPLNDVDKFLLAEEEEEDPEPPPVTNGFTLKGTRNVQPAPEPEPEPEYDVADAWTSAFPFPTDSEGEVDYEKLVPLAAAMRTVLERERDEIIRRGGPIEKQNIELKERLARMLDDMNTLRRRQQMTAEARNSLQAQVDAQTKTIRQLRNELKGRKENNQVHLNEITDILAVVDKAKGWTREMGGNGHWQIYKAGVWISDAAGSGGSTRVNQATRVKLKKAGLPV